VPNYLDNIRNFFRGIKNFLYDLLTKLFKDEDIRNKSCAQLRILDHYYAGYLVTLIYRDIQEGVITTWEQALEKYNLVALDKCCACKGIKLTSVFEDFGYPFVDCSCGIECMGFHITFQIEPDCNPCTNCGQITPIDITYDIKHLLTNPTECTNTLLTT